MRGGPALRRRVEELLAAHTTSGGSMAPPSETVGHLPDDAYPTVPHSETLPARPPPAIPGYEILGELGRGGMGVVYKARQLGLNRPVALKMVLGGPHTGHKDRVRFLAEAEAVAAIRHPHVVQVFEFGEHAGQPYFAMEFLDGGNLSRRIEDAGKLTPRDTAVMVEKIARGVQAAHDLGIVHRDLKPQNVLLDPAGEPKVTDFGLAKRGQIDLTNTNAVMGTPAYMSPEQAGGKTKFVGPGADVYALGVILYECLTGSVPFTGADAWSVIRRVIDDAPQPPRKRVPSVPRDMELICLKCLAKSPTERYGSAAELADDLRRFAAGEPVTVRAPGVAEKLARWARRKPSVAAAYGIGAVAVTLALVAVSIFGFWRAAEAAKGQAEDARDKLGESLGSESRLRGELETALGGERTAKAAEEQLREQLGRTVRLGPASFSPDGRLVVTTSRDNVLQVWDARTGRLSGLLKGHTGRVVSTSFSPDGVRVATASEDTTMRIWDARTGRALLTGKGHTGPVTSASFNPAGSRVVTASDDSTARVWDAGTGQEVFRLAGHKGHVIWASFSPDGSRVVTAGHDSTTRLWDAGTGAGILSTDSPTGRGP